MEREGRKTVKVACTVVNGATLRLFKPDDASGPFRTFVEDGPRVVLTGASPLQSGAGNTEPDGQPPGITEVDADFMERWLAQNALNPLVDAGAVRVLKDDETHGG